MDSRSTPLSTTQNEENADRRSPLPDSGYYSPPSDKITEDQTIGHNQVFTFDSVSPTIARISTITTTTVQQSSPTRLNLDHTRGAVYSRRMSSNTLRRRYSDPNPTAHLLVQQMDSTNLRRSKSDMETDRVDNDDDANETNNIDHEHNNSSPSTSSKQNGSFRPVAIVRPINPPPPLAPLPPNQEIADGAVDDAINLIAIRLREIADRFDRDMALPDQQMMMIQFGLPPAPMVVQWRQLVLEGIFRAITAAFLL